MAPDMGCYLNEADLNETDYKQAFWGVNYDRVPNLKRKYDRNGRFWCKPCVGSENLEMKEQPGQLCRVKA